MRPRPLVLVLGVALAAGCTLLTPLDEYSEPIPDAPGPDAATTSGDAAASADATTPSGDACACPTGTQDTNGICVFVAGGSHGYTCTSPIVAPPCAQSYEARLCESDPDFEYDVPCGKGLLPSVFFDFPALPPLPDGGPGKWLVKSTNTEVIARTNAACDLGTEPCAAGPSPGGTFSGGGAVLAWGKGVASGCTTVRFEVQTR